MDADDAYERIMDHIHCPYHRGNCPIRASHAADMQNPACGDRVRFELYVDGGHVRQAWFTGGGCCISQAAASMLAEFVEGRSLVSLQTFRAEQMLELLAIALSPQRRECGLLAWRALHMALASGAARP